MDLLATNAELETTSVMGTVTLCRACARRPVVYRDGRCHRCPAPTAALPGSEAKIRVLEDRAGAGQELFSPDDRTLDELTEADRRARPHLGDFRPPAR